MAVFAFTSFVARAAETSPLKKGAGGVLPEPSQPTVANSEYRSPGARSIAYDATLDVSSVGGGSNISALGACDHRAPHSSTRHFSRQSRKRRRRHDARVECPALRKCRQNHWRRRTTVATRQSGRHDFGCQTADRRFHAIRTKSVRCVKHLYAKQACSQSKCRGFVKSTVKTELSSRTFEPSSSSCMPLSRNSKRER